MTGFLPAIAYAFLTFFTTLAFAAIVCLIHRALFAAVPAVSVGPDTGDQLSVIGSPEGS